jgi:hypothetical protein
MLIDTPSAEASDPGSGPSSGQRPPAPLPSTARLSALAVWLSPIRAWRERRLAIACCQEVIEIHDRIARNKPWLRGRLLYMHVVAETCGGDFEMADRTLCAAEDSYAIWPTARPLAFSDVAHYMAVARCHEASADGSLVVSDIRPVVEALVGRLR